MTVTRLLIVTL